MRLPLPNERFSIAGIAAYVHERHDRPATDSNGANDISHRLSQPASGREHELPDEPLIRSGGRARTTDISASIRQHVQLMAESEGHYVPMQQWHHRIGMFKNTRSITARLFTRSEGAHNYCQVGNYGLALKTIALWLDGLLLENATVNSAAGNAAVRYDEIRRVTAPLMGPTIFWEGCHD